jgi:hypothetical protein
MSNAPVYETHECVQQEARHHIAMITLFNMYHNFGRVHQTLRVTPAMEADLSNHVWSILEIVSLTNHRADSMAA